MKTLARYTLVLAVAAASFFVTAAPGGGGGDSGAIWTTNGGCGPEQNVNHYPSGSHVWVNGNNFDPGTYNWEIKDPGANGTVHLSGSVTVDSGGDFCFDAGVPPDGGPYQTNVGNKNDNFSIDPPVTNECPGGDWNGEAEGCGTPPQCGPGQTGEWPNCQDPSCPAGQIGYPNCHVPTCEELQSCPPPTKDPYCVGGVGGTVVLITEGDPVPDGYVPGYCPSKNGPDFSCQQHFERWKTLVNVETELRWQKNHPGHVFCKAWDPPDPDTDAKRWARRDSE